MTMNLPAAKTQSALFEADDDGSLGQQVINDCVAPYRVR
jgi:hypothetical protein